MRSRHSYGVLKNIKLEELICHSKKEFVDLAIKLSKNLEFRDQIIKKIKKNKKLIFNNNKIIKFLEDFFISILKNK